MIAYLMAFTFLLVATVFLGGLIYTIKAFRKLGAECEEEAARKNWRRYFSY